ncbi:caspase family protein [Cryobacterium sp. TMS1-13-1]|uniref:caspase family protein n=1 Tax=Cryobacterium sp. TMS1-13-1 TaxID=1259220 RepID=UPI00106B1036|nr:caspase family protein [Cryobacterium sp. TMS1-13-1]TFD23274.1 caspase family protein [Cryobacterium sp. TMS1-13-1]
MKQLALCVGINRFENLPMSSWLNGCVNDAEDVSALLGSAFGFADSSITLLTDQAATRDAVYGTLVEALDRANTPGEHLERILFTMSSHGTQVADTDNEEPDGVDEAFATCDLRQVGTQWDLESLIVDDELHTLFSRLPEGVLLDVIFDSCHSGSGLRAMDQLLLSDDRRPRFVPPPTPLGRDGTAVAGANTRTLRDLVRTSSAVAKPVLLAACQADQEATDANFDGRYNGAFTHFLLEELRSEAGASRADVVKRVNKKLRARKFEQIAQLEAPDLGKTTAWGSAF